MNTLILAAAAAISLPIYGKQQSMLKGSGK
jgi:hypothetical protein